MHTMILGMIAMCCFIAGLFFLRFWKNTKDRFFLFFAISFWIQGLNRTLQVFIDPVLQNSPPLYLIRLAAFALILIAILDKNRARKIQS